MEPGSAPGTLRFSLTTLYGSNFEGGHFSREGNAADGTSVLVPLHRHEVSLDLTRVELALQYTLSEQWDLIARAPWETKQVHAGLTFIEPATPEERAAMQRNVDIHHRSTTLRGIGDLMLLGRRRWAGLRREGDALSVSFGATVPTGRTVENPYLLGDQGIEHQHIQFGTGTVDPLLEAGYTVPLANRFTAGAYVAGRFPLYENRQTFRGAPDATVGVHVGHRTSERLHLRLDGAVYAQGYGEWDGVRDENTGLVSTSLTAGATLHLGKVSVSGDVRYPLSQRTLHEGDAFTQGATFVLAISGRVR